MKGQDWLSCGFALPRLNNICGNYLFMQVTDRYGRSCHRMFTRFSRYLPCGKSAHRQFLGYTAPSIIHSRGKWKPWLFFIYCDRIHSYACHTHTHTPLKLKAQTIHKQFTLSKKLLKREYGQELWTPKCGRTAEVCLQSEVCNVRFAPKIEYEIYFSQMFPG